MTIGSGTHLIPVTPQKVGQQLKAARGVVNHQDLTPMLMVLGATAHMLPLQASLPVSSHSSSRR